MLHRVAVLYHPGREQAVVEAEWLGAALTARGVETSLGSGWDDATVTEKSCGRDLVVALGGDGTIIHVARLVASCAVPIVGINLGRVGFLAEMTPESMHECVDALAEGRFWIERRSMLDVGLCVDNRIDRFLALNEVTIARGLAPRAVRVRTMLDGDEYLTYTADGVIVATATGSTAYSLAAGGPILYPEATDFVITPVAPHLHIGRSMIVPQQTTVTLELVEDRLGVMSVDGSEERELDGHHIIQIRRSQTVGLFARLGPRRYFYSAIAARLR